MKLKRFLTGVLSAVMALSVCALPALADDANTTTTAPSTSTIDTGKKGSITIHKYLVEGDVTGSSNYGEKLTDKPAYEAAKDVGFSIYQVMTAEELVAYYNGKDNTEPKASDYKIDAADKTKVTKDSKEYKRSRGEQKTDATGVTTFDQLEVGLYLVVETTKPAAVTEAVAPFLVSVPMTRVGEDGKTAPTEWLYDIHVYPKNSTQTGTIYLKKQGLVGGTEISNPTDLNGVQFKLERLKEGKNVGDTDAWEIVTSEKNNNGIYTTDTVEENKSGTIKVDGLHPGTYRFTEVGYADSAAGVDKKYILDTAASYTFKIEAGDDGTQKVTQLDTDNKDYTINGTTITVTNYAPDVDKQVVNRTDGNTYQEAADYAVGDKIPYRIAVTIPTNIAKLKTFYLTDTPENLDDDTRIQFYSNSDCKALITKSLVKETAGITSTNNAKGKGFKIDFDPAKLEEYAGKTIYITYEATLKKGADTTTAGNHNKVDLTYSNKIKSGNVLEDETADHNHIEDTAVVYTFQIDITKVGKDGNKETPLDGVTFKLYEQIAHQTETGEKVLSDDDAKALGFKDTNKFSYKEVATGTTEGGGKLTFTGLSNSKTATTGASRYWLVETQTKEGYNLLGAPVEAKLDIVYKTTWKEKNTFDKGVLVKHSHDANTETFKTPNDGSQTNNGTQEGTEQSAGLDRGEKVTYGILSTEIINKKGFQLPVTGGFGTLLFSGIGVLLVLAGVAVLFSMKKKNDRA
ncbi:SpaH/EbpB family LPXTG-anchored major pilin [uncultured Gemmiger sp.]|jgi:fimbrial isopeptide formation D2 family protein/LPXTG-motif cell wall-anchored protein|uniref:SpaH/EbpB family LPXTG-anchored major pilin n=1 Tax=uncultured Gemmiger sp. TaxID=1623490 RepID=UPI00266DA2A7|nr:SpaH/EbpB family LPXTG-anchored major pilin [uncultured Gemmiger sp.]